MFEKSVADAATVAFNMLLRTLKSKNAQQLLLSQWTISSLSSLWVWLWLLISDDLTYLQVLQQEKIKVKATVTQQVRYSFHISNGQQQKSVLSEGCQR